MFFLLLAFSSVQAINPQDYPLPNAVPPVNSEWTKKILSSPKTAGPMVDRCPNANDWAFTSDDGPSPQTPIALQGLKDNNAKGT